MSTGADQLANVLLVDDEDDIRTVAEAALTAVGGLDVMCASNGTEALELVRKRRPDVVLLDVMMPGLGGPEVLAKLQSEHGDEAPPVIFMTAKVQSVEIEGFKKLGVVGVIKKPFDPMTLHEEIGRILNDHAG